MFHVYVGWEKTEENKTALFFKNLFWFHTMALKPWFDLLCSEDISELLTLDVAWKWTFYSKSNVEMVFLSFVQKTSIKS